MNADTFIYGLWCPSSGALRYIGKADNPQKRFNCHISHATTTNKEHYSARWIRGLLGRGMKPIMTILECVPAGQDWRAAEQRSIAAALESGAPLTNITPGGEGVVLSADGKARLSEKSKARWADKEYARRCVRTLSESIKNKWKTDDSYRSRVAANSKVAWHRVHAGEKYQIDQVRELVNSGGQVFCLEQICCMFPSTRRSIIARHLKTLRGEGLCRWVSKGWYLRGAIKDPRSVAVAIYRAIGYAAVEENFSISSIAMQRRIRKDDRDITRLIKVGDIYVVANESAKSMTKIQGA